MNTIPAAAALLEVAQVATEMAERARAAAPKLRKPATPDQHVLLMVAKGFEAQERTAWATLLEYVCANGDDDQGILGRIGPHLATVSGEVMLVPGMDTASLKHHVGRIMGDTQHDLPRLSPQR